jgi:toxin FitB
LSSGYLLNTSMLSALAPGREALVPSTLRDWLQTRHTRLYLPAITIADVAQGIGRLRRAGGAERADRLDLWLDALLASCGDRILPLDAAVARVAGRMSDEATARGRHPSFAEVAIAAMAQQSGLLLLTCNLKHFEALGVECADPLMALPSG